MRLNADMVSYLKEPVIVYYPLVMRRYQPVPILPDLVGQ